MDAKSAKTTVFHLAFLAFSVFLAIDQGLK